MKNENQDASVKAARPTSNSSVLLFAVLHRADESQPARETAVFGCILILGLVSIMSLSC